MQKNEALNKKLIVFVGKEHFFGSSMTMADQIALLAIEDSLGYQDGLARLFAKIGLPFSAILHEWSKWRDIEEQMKTIYRQLPTTKVARANRQSQVIIASSPD